MLKILQAILGLVLLVSPPPIPENYAILDNVGRVNQATISHVYNGNNQLYWDTGGEIYFYITNSVPMGFNIESYSLAVFNEWRPGRTETDNGVLVTIAASQGLVWMTVGEGLSQHMPAFAINNLLTNHFREYFNQGYYDLAIINLFNALVDEIYQLFPPSIHQYVIHTAAIGNQSAANYWLTSFLAILIILTAIVIVMFIFRNYRSPIMTMGKRKKLKN